MWEWLCDLGGACDGENEWFVRLGFEIPPFVHQWLVAQALQRNRERRDEIVRLRYLFDFL